MADAQASGACGLYARGGSSPPSPTEVEPPCGARVACGGGVEPPWQRQGFKTTSGARSDEHGRRPSAGRPPSPTSYRTPVHLRPLGPFPPDRGVLPRPSDDLDEVADPLDCPPEDSSGIELVGIAGPGDLLTVDEMQTVSTIHEREQGRRTAAALGRFATDVPRNGTDPSSAPGLRFVKAGASLADVSFPRPPAFCVVDSSGRLKLPDSESPSDVLGWVHGSLEVTIVDGWATLTQPDDLRNVRRRGRNASHAGYRPSGTPIGSA